MVEIVWPRQTGRLRCDLLLDDKPNNRQQIDQLVAVVAGQHHSPLFHHLIYLSFFSLAGHKNSPTSRRRPGNSGQVSLALSSLALAALQQVEAPRQRNNAAWRT